QTNFTNLTDGAYTYKAYAIDEAGNMNSTEERTLTVDTEIPAIKFASPTPEDNAYLNVNWTYINVSVSDENNVSAFIDWNRSLVGYWSFDSFKNITYVYDNSTYGNNGTMYGGLATSNSSVNGRYGQGLVFDGVDDYVNCGNDGSLDLTDAITIEAWVKPLGGAQGRYIFSTTNVAGGGIHFYIRSGGGTEDIVFSFNDAGTRNYHIAGDIEWGTEKWKFITGVWDGTNIHIYVDNNKYTGLSTSSVTHDFDGGFIGAEKGAGSLYPFNGTIDEVRIWNRALTPEEINASYSAGLYRLQTNLTNQPDGTYTYKAYAIDEAGNMNSTEERTLIIDTTPPIINCSFNISVDAVEINDVINFSCNVSDETGLSTINMTWNMSNEIVYSNYTASGTDYKVSNYTAITVGYGEVINFTGYVTDSSWNVKQNSTLITITDTTQPSVTLISPISDTGDIDGNMAFSYNVTDASNVTNCSLVINSNLNLTNSSVTKNATQNLLLNNLQAGSYNWSVNCSDKGSNTGESETRQLAVFMATDFTITDLSSLNVTNITNLTIERPGYGKINFSQPVDLSAGADINAYVNISSNRIEINSTALPQLNKSANLLIYNLTFSNPRILRDGSLCPSTICTRIGYAGNNLTFNVTKFTAYSSEETPSAAEEAAAGGGGGGAAAGGGGGGAIILPKTDFSLSRSSIKAELVIGQSTARTFEVTNTGETAISGKIGVRGMEDMLFLSGYSFSLEPQQTALIEANIIAKQTGVFSGKIIVSAEGVEKEISVIVEVETEEVLFDVKIDIPTEHTKVTAGNNMETQITLLSMGLPKKLDVSITYTIMDMAGNTISKEYETIAVEKQLTFAKSFPVPENLGPGEYLIAMEVSYANAIATAGELFTVIEEPVKMPKLFKMQNLVWLIASLAVTIMILGAYCCILLKKPKKKLKKEIYKYKKH
ncbi:hypothetical protein KY347_03285, partial [Candidatus Woesearchaeota archaeon]|nr:hypothetical protein [Candidatus Woesearchaeota archaeon]